MRRKPSGPFSGRPSAGTTEFSSPAPVFQAFDQLDPYAVEQALLEHDAPACAIEVVLLQLVEQRVWPSVVGVICHSPVELDRGAGQGAPAPPTHHVDFCGAGEAPLGWCQEILSWLIQW